MFIVDAHLDLSMNALEWNRDLTQPIAAINEREAGLTDKPDRGKGVVSLPELRKGRLLPAPGSAGNHGRQLPGYFDLDTVRFIPRPDGADDRWIAAHDGRQL